MQTKVNAALFPPGSMTANGTLHLPLEDNFSELMTTLGYLALSLTKPYIQCSYQTHQTITIIKTLSYNSYSTCFLGLTETFIMNCFPRLSLLQARLHHTSMATLALQHQHHQFGSPPISDSTFDNWATSFYSTRSPSSRIQRPKLLHHKQTLDCSSQGEVSP